MLLIDFLSTVAEGLDYQVPSEPEGTGYFCSLEPM